MGWSGWLAHYKCPKYRHFDLTFDLTVGSSGRYAMEAAEMLVSLLDYKSLESLTSIAPSTTDIPTYHIMTL